MSETKEERTDDVEACPTMIEHYRIGDKLGRGAFATVYKALDSESGDFVAIKRIRVDRIKSKQLMKLLSEGHLMEQLEHENVVKFLGAIETENHIHLVLEYVDSGSLHSVIQKYGNLSEKLAARYLRQVLSGLAYLHENGVVHRDLKSHNMLLSSSGVIKLADFGIAHLYGGDPATQSLQDTDVGSPYWMAPEVIQLIEASPASDIWSIGCTLLELLTGEPPYYQLSKTAACFRMVEDEHPPFPEGFSAGVTNFLSRCLKKDPKERASAAELEEDPWVVENKKATMRKYVSITNLPRFQVNAQESKKAAQKAAMVKKSISVTTLPRYAVNPTLEGDVNDFKSLRGTPKALEDAANNAPVAEHPKSKSLSGSHRGSLRIKKDRASEDTSISGLFGRKKSPGRSGEKDDLTSEPGRKSGKHSPGRSGDTKDELGKSDPRLNDDTDGQSTPETLSPRTGKKSGGSKIAKQCSECGVKFGFMQGKTACEQCREAFCKNCISKKVTVPSLGKAVRLCGSCLQAVSREEREQVKIQKESVEAK